MRERVTMLDQSPHQLARARAKPALAALRQGDRRRRGPARSRPTASIATCRPAASSTGRIRSARIAEAYRVLRAGRARAGRRPRAARAPAAARARRDVDALPDRGSSTATGSAARGSPASSSCTLAPPLVPQHARAVRRGGERAPSRSRARRRCRCQPPAETVASAAAARPAARARSLRFAGGSLAGALFVPLAAALALRHAAAGAARAVTSRAARADAGAAGAAAGPARGAVALHPPAHGDRHRGQHRRPVRHLRRRAAAASGSADGIGDLAWTLLAGFCVNVYIVGAQPARGHRDRPGQQAVPAARRRRADGRPRRVAIVAACAVVPVVLALTQGAVETGRACSPGSPSAPPTRARRCA